MDNWQLIMGKALELFVRGYDAVGVQELQNSPKLQNRRCIIILEASRD